MIQTGPITIFQKNWAFTTANSERTKIQTGSCGPCYVVTFVKEKESAAMAHIDDTTDVDTMDFIFKKFIESSIKLEDVKVVILGGWKENQESKKWGGKIVKKIEEAGFKNVNKKHMYLKKAMTVVQEILGISPAETPNHYHFGAMVDSTNGKTYFLKEYMTDIEEKQLEQNEKYGSSSQEFPLTLITS